MLTVCGEFSFLCISLGFFIPTSNRSGWKLANLTSVGRSRLTDKPLKHPRLAKMDTEASRRQSRLGGQVAATRPQIFREGWSRCPPIEKSHLLHKNQTHVKLSKKERDNGRIKK